MEEKKWKQPSKQRLQYQYCENSFEELKGLHKFQENFLNCKCFFEQIVIYRT